MSTYYRDTGGEWTPTGGDTTSSWPQHIELDLILGRLALNTAGGDVLTLSLDVCELSISSDGL